jgi:hypothetical protein
MTGVEDGRLLKLWIKHQTTIPYNPQQNGVAERMNRTLLNMVRSMMFFKNVKLMFWVDTILCVVYVKNNCPSHALENKTPYEIWYGRIPLMKHLRVFGSTCFALIPKEQRNKLDARSQKCIFFGYSNTTKGYRLYDEVNKKFILSKDVVFLESSKNDKIVERQLDHLDKFTHVKRYNEFDDEIPHLEGVIPILDQSMESPFEAPSNQSGLFQERLETTVIHCDSQNCLKLTQNPVFHDRSKHIEMKYHFIRDMVQRRTITLQYIRTDEQIANILTKLLSLGKFVYYRDKLGFCLLENLCTTETSLVWQKMCPSLRGNNNIKRHSSM